jgi:hypothetical protein
MNQKKWVVLATFPGDLQAELLRGLLESQSIPAEVLKEGAGRAIGLTVGPLGESNLLVPADMLDQANAVLDDYYRGAYRVEDEFEETDSQEDADYG